MTLNDSACYTRYQVVSVCTALHAMYGAFIGDLFATTCARWIWVDCAFLNWLEKRGGK